MTRVVVAMAWLLAGHAVAAAIYVALINTPESNALMLAQSVVLVCLGVLVLLMTSMSVAVALQRQQRPWQAVPASVPLLPIALVAGLLVGLICAGAGWFDRWWVTRSGEVDAALMATADVTRTGWLHATVGWTVALVQWVVVPVWLAASLAWAAAYGVRHVLSGKWLVAGLRPRLVLLTLLVVVLLVWLPWRAVYWRPAALTAGTLEMAFTSVKLFTLLLLANLAWALVLDEAVRPHRQ